MKRLALLLPLLALAILVAGGLTWRESRDEACRRELADLVSGPVVPGAASVRSTWSFACHDAVSRFGFDVESGGDFGADVVRRVDLLPQAIGEDPHVHWSVREGSPSEERLLGFLRSDSFVETVRNGPREPDRGRLRFFRSGLEDVFGGHRIDVAYVPEPELLAFGKRLVSFLETEAARPSVAFREERTIWSLDIEAWTPYERPGRFKKAIGRVSKTLDGPDAVRNWAAASRDVSDDPLHAISVGGLSFKIVEGLPRASLRFRLKEPSFPDEICVADGTPLADAIRELCAARRPWTFGAFFGPGMTVDSDDYTTRIDVRDGTEWRTTILKRYTPRFRSFMTELFSLLAAPAPHAESAEGAKEPAP